jgi:hypothetical protein
VLAWIDLSYHEILVVNIDMISSVAPSRKVWQVSLVYVCIVFVLQQKYSLN